MHKALGHDTTACDVALLTTAAFVATPASDDWYGQQIHLEEQLVARGLESRGLRVARLDWADASVDWDRVGCAVFRSTWDYFERFDEFRPWLDATATRTRFINDYALVVWNIDKHYLADLERAGVDVVPTVFIEQGAGADLGSLSHERGWDEIIVKPAVSGTARETHRAACHAIASLQPHFNRLVAREAMLIQPFQPEVLALGEISLMVINGQFTHAIRKTPKAGDFRVQDDHGGTVHSHEASSAEKTFAERAVAACPIPPTYARVDIVTTPDGCRLMELELIEPELFFRFHPPAADAMAHAITEKLPAASG